MVRSRRVLPVLALAVVCAAAMAAPAWAADLPVKNVGISPELFQPSEACGCHSTFIEQWSRSMHAQSMSDPLYLTKLEEAEKATDGAIGPFCKKCHAPAAEMTGEIAKGSERSPGTGEGINCSFCHQISGMSKGVIGNVSQLVDPSGVRRAQLKDPQAPHPTAYSELHEKAKICGGCHNVNHPINGMHLESTFSEWEKGPYAKKGIVCQDCHMSTKPGEIGPTTGQAAGGAPQRDNIYQMIFVGGQVGLGPSDVATARLQSAATIQLEIPEIVSAGESAKTKVTITNSGAGHYLPTGLTEVRQMWLEVTATGADGSVVKLGERMFGTILEDDAGNAPVELWDATKIKSDDRIPPLESVTNEYDFSMPAGADRSSVKAALLYKSASDEFAEKADVNNPVTEMAVAEQVVFSSAEAKANDLKKPAEEAPTSPEEGSSSGSPLIPLVGGGVLIVALGGLAWMKARKKNA